MSVATAAERPPTVVDLDVGSTSVDLVVNEYFFTAPEVCEYVFATIQEQPSTPSHKVAIAYGVLEVKKTTNKLCQNRLYLLNCSIRQC